MHVQLEIMLGKTEKNTHTSEMATGRKKCHTGNEMKVNRLVLETQSRAATKLNLVHLLEIRQDLMKMVKCWENSVGFSTIAIAMIFKALRIDDENAWIVQRVNVVDYGPKFRMEKNLSIEKFP